MPVVRGKSVEKIPVAVRHGRHVFGFLLAAFHLQRMDAGVGDLGEMLPRAEVPGGDQVAAVQLRAARGIGQHVVLAARLGAGSPVGAAFRNHAGHVALPRVRDAERAVDEALQHQLRDRAPDGADVVQGILSREHHAVASQVAQDAGAALVVHGHLGRAVNLQIGVQLADEPHRAEVLHDGGVDAAINALAEMVQRVVQLGRLEEDVERQIDPGPVRVRQAAGLL